MFSRILVPLDGSELAEQATGVAAALARGSNAEVSLVLAHEMAPYPGGLAPPWSDAETPDEDAYVRSMAGELANDEGIVANGCVSMGDPADVINRRAREIGADLIVMTSHGRTGLGRMWLGSVADAVVRDAPAPVLMLRATGDQPVGHSGLSAFGRILVALEGGATPPSVLAAAGELARASGGTLILVRVITPVPLLALSDSTSIYPTAIIDEDVTEQLADTARDELTQLARSLEREGLKAEADVVVGAHVASRLLEFAKAKDADLIAIMTHGRGASRLVIGSVADKVLRDSHLPLLVLNAHTAAPSRHLDAYVDDSLAR